MNDIQMKADSIARHIIELFGPLVMYTANGHEINVPPNLVAHEIEPLLVQLRNSALNEAVEETVSWGDQCAGGSGGEIVTTGPSKGQRYGEGYYNLAKKIASLKTE